MTVFSGICASKTPLVFVDEGVKINQNFYRREPFILDAVVAPWARRHFGRQQWTLQQDSVPAHRAKVTQERCKAHFIDFITSTEYSPYTRRISTIWTTAFYQILEARACGKPHKNLEAL